MKRSAQIGLLVMGALTTTSAAGYFANNHEQACQARAADNPQQPQQDCRRSVWHGSGHGWGGSHFFSSPSSSSSASAVATSSHAPAGTSSAARGGFGGHGGGGSGS